MSHRDEDTKPDAKPTAKSGKYIVVSPVIDPMIDGEKRADVALERYLSVAASTGLELVAVRGAQFIFKKH